MFRDIGFPELLVILLIALLLFGAGKLPDIGRALGKSIHEFKKGMKEGSDEGEKDKENKKDTSTPV